MEKLILIDGNSILNRAYYGIPLLQNNNGEYTNAVYGFLNIMFRFIDEEKPTHIAIAFDVKAKTFRHEQFSEYKGTRKGMPDELRAQLPLIKNLLKLMNITYIEKEGFEADDVLGTLAKEAEEKGLNPVIISGDKDLLQLATDKTKIRIPKTKKGKTEVEDYLKNDVIEKIGLTPTEFIDMKGLMGDTSDNIPGVPGIGEKTALKIITQFKSIENAIQNIEDVKPKKAKENLEQFKEQALMSKELATIITDVPLEYELTQFIIENIFNEEAFEEVKRLELKSIFKKFDEVQEAEKKEIQINVIDNPFDIDDLLENLLKCEQVSYNFYVENEILTGISFAMCNDQSYVILIDDNLSEEVVLQSFKTFFESDTKKITIDKKRDLKFFKSKGININNIYFDVSLALYLEYPTKSDYNYNDIALTYLGENYLSEEEIFGKGKKALSFYELEHNTKIKFLSDITSILFRSFNVSKENLEQKQLDELYFNVELPLEEVLCDMEDTGVKIDKNYLMQIGEDLDVEIDKLTNQIHLLAGEEFNINSPSQLGEILFNKLGLKGGKKTKTGYSTSVEVLEKLVKVHPIIELVLNYRTYTKLKSTYVQGLLKVLDEHTHKIHSTFTQKITATGRLSSIEPNLQNIPVRTEVGRELRKVFVPTNDEYVFVGADYSQIELRVLAHIADDETLINAYKNNEDIHRLTASQVFNVPYDEVTDYQRSNAKAVNFGIVYGISSFSLSQDLYITKKEADKYIKGYFEKYPKVKQYLDNVISETKEKGYVTTIFNRRRNVPEINSTNFVKRGFGERIAMNMPIQGTSADIIKMAMNNVYRRLKTEKLQSKLILQIHDELLIETKKDEVEKVKQILRDEMENVVKLKVDLSIDMAVGNSWFETK